MKKLVWLSNASDLNYDPETGVSTPRTPDNKWDGPCRVFLDGIDMTSRCFRINRYDDGSADIECYVMDAEGRHVLTHDGSGVETEILCGSVRTEAIY